LAKGNWHKNVAKNLTTGVNPHYTSIFCKKNMFFTAFFYIKFGFVIFCQNNIVKKAAHKMLVELTIGLFNVYITDKEDW